MEEIMWRIRWSGGCIRGMRRDVFPSLFSSLCLLLRTRAPFGRSVCLTKGVWIWGPGSGTSWIWGSLERGGFGVSHNPYPYPYIYTRARKKQNWGWRPPFGPLLGGNTERIIHVIISLYPRRPSLGIITIMGSCPEHQISSVLRGYPDRLCFASRKKQNHLDEWMDGWIRDEMEDEMEMMEMMGGYP